LLFIAGICLMLLGVALRWYSVSVLGKYFTFDLAIHSGQVLVEVGPYRYIRHPSYSGALLSLLGFGLALGNWAGLAFLRLKKRYDPEERFQSDWYRHYRTMFADIL
jgi:protein-S-isoprenylcysteine O-methyltransferase